MKKQKIYTYTIISIAIILISWGSTGHKMINQKATLSFNQQMMQFLVWTSDLTNHASDADYRKDTDTSESPKHYIDIDNYQDFVFDHRILQDWDSIINAFGYSSVINEGILPWATVTTFDTLTKCFARQDWNKAILTAADLGHYVADGHMPLHISKNYNGQLTGNTGIHSRYESTMIGSYSSQIVYSGDTNLQVIQNVNQYVFNYIYNNYKYKDSILIADNQAKIAAGGSTTSSVYTQNLWNKTKGFTTLLFQNASHALAELIYTAWVNGGSPAYTPNTITENKIGNEISEFQVFPNPISDFTYINFSLKENTDNLHLSIIDQNGKTIKTLINNNKYIAGNYNFRWQTENIAKGNYFCVLRTSKSLKSIKLLLVN